MNVRLFMFLAFTLWGCGSSGTVRTPTDQSALLVHQAAANSFAVAEKIETTTFEIRQNPATCDCPMYETFIYGYWNRVLVEPETMRTQLGDFTDKKSVSGSLSKSKAPDSRGVRYLVLTVDGIK